MAPDNTDKLPEIPDEDERKDADDDGLHREEDDRQVADETQNFHASSEQSLSST
jgi:hypothetical protein